MMTAYFKTKNNHQMLCESRTNTKYKTSMLTKIDTSHGLLGQKRVYIVKMHSCLLIFMMAIIGIKRTI